MMSQGHPIYTQHPDAMRYHNAPTGHGMATHGAAAMHQRRTHHALPSPPPPATSVSPYPSDPRCWSPSTAPGSANTLPPIMALAAIAPPPGPTPAPSPTTLVHSYLGTDTHGIAAPEGQPRAKRHKSISAGAEEQQRSTSPQQTGRRRPSTKRGSAEAQQSADEAAGSTGVEAARILEERRRRNANASARFRKRRNERERELVARCLFLEHHLLQSVGAGAFDHLMRKAPAAAAIEGSAVGRRSAASIDVRDLLVPQIPEPADEDPAPDSTGRNLSVTALTTPRTMDDVWSAYMALSQQISSVAQRVQSLEDYR